jgi:hypothetical protein
MSDEIKIVMPGEEPPQQPSSLEQQKPVEQPEPAEQKPVEQPVKEAFDPTIFGPDFKSVDDVKQFISSTQPRLQELSALQKKMEEVKNQSPFTDELLYKLDRVKAIRPDQFDLAKKVAFGSADPFEIIQIKLEKDYPELFAGKGAQEKIDFVKSQYDLEHGLKPYSEEDDRSPEEVDARLQAIREADKRVAQGKMRFEIDRKKALGDIQNDLFQGIEVPKPVSKEDADRQSAALLESWDSVIKSNPLSTIEIMEFNHADGKPSKAFDAPITPEKYAEYANEFAQANIGSGAAPSKQAPEDLKGYIRNRYVIDNFDQLMTQQAHRAREMNDDQWRRSALFNAKPASSTERPSGDTGVKTTQDEVDRVLGNK